MKLKYLLIPLLVLFVSCSTNDSGTNKEDEESMDDTSGGTDDPGGGGNPDGLSSIVSTIYDNGVEQGTFTFFIENGQLTSGVNFDGSTTTVTYENGVVSQLRTVRPNGELEFDSFFEYDSQGRLTRYYSNPINLRSDNVYEYVGNQVLLTVTWYDQSGNQDYQQNYTLDRNSQGLFVRQESDEGNVEEIEYDNSGNPIRFVSTRPGGTNDYEIALTFTGQVAQDANQYFRFLFGNKYQTNGVLYNVLLNNTIARISRNYFQRSECVVGNCQLQVEATQEFDNQGRIVNETRTSLTTGELIEVTNYLYD